MYPYQLGTLPTGCYCNSGYTSHCLNKREQSSADREQFVQDWNAAVAHPRFSSQAAQHFALRYGWRVRNNVETMLEQRSPQLMPYLESLGCGSLNVPFPQQANTIYNSLLNRAF